MCIITIAIIIAVIVYLPTATIIITNYLLVIPLLSGIIAIITVLIHISTFLTPYLIKLTPTVYFLAE